MAVKLRLPHLLALFTPLLVAAAPPPPPGLAPYINDGRFEPGDYRWLRGMFDGAGPVDVATYKAMLDWRQRCRASDMAETRTSLAELGVSAGVSLDSIPYRTLICDQIATLPEPLNLHDWVGFTHDVSVVRPIIQGFLTAVSMGEKTTDFGAPDLRDALNARKIAEQTLRAGLLWGGDSTQGDSPKVTLTAQQRGILTAELAMAMAARDHANTEWLKDVVMTQGWPKRSQVGERAAKTAWLLAQHADADPAFQVRALRLIEPLVATGEADSKSYAYLYDRVMLKLVGKQRYGTQLICKKDRLLPMQLEDERKVDSNRRSLGLDTLAEYEARALKDYGSCQSDP
jgi:hypothetical protein